jgi:outer membrane protein OmpU
MNKMTKLGVSALCGSLAAVSAANAGDLTVTGGVDMSWMSFDDSTTGNPLGLGSNYTIAGSGELDNGWSVALSIAMKNKNIYSNTSATVTIPALGDIRVDGGISGTGIDRIDDVTPNVWEEAYGTGLSNGIDTVGGISGAQLIEYTPNMLPDGLTINAAWTASAAGSQLNDKASGGEESQSALEDGYDVAITATDAITGMSGLTLYGGIGKTNIDEGATDGNYDGDEDELTFAAKYAIGSFTVGYQWSEEDLGISANEQEYENEGYGITFQVNDDLSIGYNHYESDQTSTTSVTNKASSLQLAYSVGGASLRIARSSSDNEDYQTTALYDKDATTISVSLAF